ncbi:chemotaxis protein CheY [Novosphingobium barchaimii LL02]|uniref:Chemotaxis protein CheY n=1 Tax=Novosphingobium barchaimii LL02 TaxID=1114963 RepID=A0A0J7XW96_9SPHN|nr:response regulator [Novosphingobium barchaimii]KMS55991.1 chemotaxis protein CheY [Novosphingobium barchaimii LL02]
MESSTAPFALVVDDDVLVLMHASDMLTDAGFQALEARDGDEAKAIIAEHGEEIVLVFTDVQMPGETDGFALAHYVAERWKEIRIVVASGGIRPAPGELPIGAIFIAKPFTAEVVHDHLRSLLPEGKLPISLRPRP